MKITIELDAEEERDLLIFAQRYALVKPGRVLSKAQRERAILRAVEMVIANTHYIINGRHYAN